MSVSRYLLLAAILLGCKDKPSQTAGSATRPVAAAPVPDPIAAPKSPALPPRPSLAKSPGNSTAESTFAAETRDDDWAEGAENEIQKRFEKVRGAKLEAAECRQSQCKLTIAGSEGDVSRTIADLESNRGLHGYAKNILLTAPERKADGSLVLRAFALFER